MWKTEDESNKIKIFFWFRGISFLFSFHSYCLVDHHRLMCLSSTLPNQCQFELKKYHQVGCHERHILKTMKMETETISVLQFLRKHQNSVTAVMRPLLISAYWSRFMIGGFFWIAIKNISTSFCVDLSTAVKFTFSRRVWNSKPTYLEKSSVFKWVLNWKRNWNTNRLAGILSHIADNE